MDGHQIDSARKHIDSYWQELVVSQQTDLGTIIGLPHPYLTPTLGSGHFSFQEQYYWDSFFMAIGLREQKHEELVSGMLDNLIHLQQRFGIIPNASRTYFTGRSQPPLLTSFIFYLHDQFGKSTDWLLPRIEVAKTEYNTVWRGTNHPNWRDVFAGLSRYYDVNVLHDFAEMESGWDLTPRFNARALDHIPIDLNAILYKNELDFARAAELFGNDEEQNFWLAAAEQRKQSINKYLWHHDNGFYFDFNYQEHRQSEVWSLAPYFAMWAHLVDQDQAQALRDNLYRFEHAGGLTATAEAHAELRNHPMQWAYPNGWAPLHYIVWKGLRNYGFHEDAERIKNKWLKTNLDWFSAHGEFLEKYNVVNPAELPTPGAYPTQSGFGWTNAVFERFCANE